MYKRQALETRKSAVENTPVFSLDLTKDKVTDQKASGRCWMFAALNTFRHKMIASFQLEDFELSQAHTFFWDKYEKSNWFLEQIIATADQDLTSRKVAFLLPVSYTHLDVYKRQNRYSLSKIQKLLPKPCKRRNEQHDSDFTIIKIFFRSNGPRPCLLYTSSTTMITTI